ncbi:hypothetical protein MsedC_1940 [Metallosphaera sedula]|uniref:Uncharacterized protein n=2 Tax=Metallosphaera sedula TaxID=43687 RepID=A4YHY0_METS5|nr:hypothetical protein [Metallosphaera sedula]ABP96032.1 hypothetical protein Msed_1892 [Metallosphaera sedula DSM 5348]AKV79339.1 hypothetical protein MsedC_1940 [Metallosphaera sedula]AKV81584.1 hypothetical protein MsedD_1941 [Metallosphaera sedula]AKV83816.1 hypothetical protein MsedE_1941 [Metallosphaera sedula]WPX05871.1 hypothetical protein SOJ17_001899 [Metallosphaera sedula DSM 5348]
MVLNDRLLSDAKFYGKLIGVLLNKEDTISGKIKGTALERRVMILKVDPEEYPDYLIRITRGVIPCLSVLTPNIELVGIIESNNVDYMMTSLKDMLNSFETKKIRPVKIPEYTPEPLEPSEASIFDTVNKVIDQQKADFRVIEMIKTISRVEKRYSTIEKFLSPMDEVASYLLGGGDLKGEFAIYEAVKTIKGEPSKLEEYVKDGKVFRSSKKENWGLLIDEAIVGYAFLMSYLREGKDEYLEQAIKIRDYVKRELETEKGFRDTVPKDPLTSITYLEPLANAEIAIFLSALWQATGDEETRKMAIKALGIASVRSDFLGVSARIAHSLLRLNHGILTSIPGNYEDVRVMLNKGVNCRFKQGDKCAEKLEEFSGLGLED